MEPHEKYEQLKSAADAARVTLIQLEQERDELNKRLSELIEPINMLKNVIAAWDAINREPAGQASFPEIPPARHILVEPAPEGDRLPRGVVVARVEQIMSDGVARSAREVIDEIKRRFNVDENANSVAMVLKRRASRGIYRRDAGKFQLSL